MSAVIAVKMATIFAVIAVGWGAAQTAPFRGPVVVRVMSAAAFNLFVPAMLLRTTARVSLSTLPWPTLAAFFGPVVALLFATYTVARARFGAADARAAVQAISTTFGNGLQLGLPMVSSLFGPDGVTVHIAIISLHALILLTTATVLAEMDVARSNRAEGKTARGGWAVVATTARRAVVHPIVLPVLVGLAWNASGLPFPGPVDDVLGTLSEAVGPMCLVTIGLSLANYGLRGAVWPATVLAAGKLLLQPALVLTTARLGMGLHGVALSTVTLFAGLPIGSNALLFAQRYQIRQPEVTAGILLSTVGFVLTAPLWLFVAGLASS